MLFVRLTISPDGLLFTLGPDAISAPSGFLARQWLRQRTGDDTLQVTPYVGTGKVRVVAEIRVVGSAAGVRNTRRNEVRERDGRGRWGGWRRLG